MPIQNFDTVTGALKQKKVVLLILDGWGMSPSWSGNAVAFADPVNFNRLWRSYPHAVLQAFRGVADKEGKVGNSEIGHASIGTGRIVKQDLTEINEAIKRGYFFQNPILLEATKRVNKFKSKLHIIGMLSDGGVHSHTDHIKALLRMAKMEKVKDVYVHVITDGIDSPDRSAIRYVSKLQDFTKKLGVGKITSIVGRYWAMDKSGHTDRIEKAYLLQTRGKGQVFSDPADALKNYYSKGLFDSHIPPTIITNNKSPIVIGDYDSVIFSNFRPDRAANLTRAYVDKNYFKSIIGRKYSLFKDMYFVTLTSYMLDEKVPVNVAFPSVKIEDSLSQSISRAGFRQLHIAETEKSPHVTYFFNGGILEPYKGEDRMFVKSPNVKNYAEKPEMSTEKLTKMIIKAIKSDIYQFIVANIANVDMVAHTGDIQATSKAVKFTDAMIGEIVKANHDFTTIITADHGNAEEIIPYRTSSNRATFHTINPVPFIVVEKSKERDYAQEAIQSTHVPMYDVLESPHNLADIAPTILDIFGINRPQGMTGHSLLKNIGYK